MQTVLLQHQGMLRCHWRGINPRKPSCLNPRPCRGVTSHKRSSYLKTWKMLVLRPSCTMSVCHSRCPCSVRCRPHCWWTRPSVTCCLWPSSCYCYSVTLYPHPPTTILYVTGIVKDNTAKTIDWTLDFFLELDEATLMVCNRPIVGRFQHVL